MTDLIAETLANPAVGAVGTAVLMAVVGLWLAAAWWAYADATRRTESTLAGFVAVGWIILSSPLLLPFSLAAYTFARPQVSAADRRTRSLAAEFVLAPGKAVCASCALPVEDAWLRCPTCTAWLAAPCAHCGRWSDSNLDLCPWCGNQSREQPFVASVAMTPAIPSRSRRRRKPSRASGPKAPRANRRDGRPAVARAASRAATGGRP